MFNVSDALDCDLCIANGIHLLKSPHALGLSLFPAMLKWGNAGFSSYSIHMSIYILLSQERRRFVLWHTMSITACNLLPEYFS